MSSTGHTAPSGARDVEVSGRRYTEAKNGIRTSECHVMVAFAAAVLVATYLNADSVAGADGWRFGAFAVVAYVLSRGLVKLGVRQPSPVED